MVSKRLAIVLAALPVSAAVVACSVTAASAAVFPNIGYNTGPQILITLSGTNTAALTNPLGQGPYDGSDDAYIGVLNNTSQAISTLSLSSSLNIFGFESDGIGVPDYTTYPGNGYSTVGCVCQFGAANGGDSSGYGGPHGSFSGITYNAGVYSGIISFDTPIAANGGIDWFALEEPLTAASFQITGVNGGPATSATPLPASWTMMLIGFAGLGFASYRATAKNKKKSLAVAAA